MPNSFVASAIGRGVAGAVLLGYSVLGAATTTAATGTTAAETAGTTYRARVAIGVDSIDKA